MGDSWSFGKNLASTHSIKKSIGIIYEAIAPDIQHTHIQKIETQARGEYTGT